MRVPTNARRVTAARAVVSAYGTVTTTMSQWYAEAGSDGLTTLAFKDLWKVFRKDAKINSASECYNTLYVTLQRLVVGQPKAKAAKANGARKVRVSKAARKVLNSATAKLLELGYTVTFTLKLDK